MKVLKANRAVFIDRDGTINHDCPYCKDPDQLIIYDDAVEIMRDYQEKGFLVIIVTNQSGVNRGYFTETELENFNLALRKELEKRGVRIDALYYCPHRPDENCSCRKPRTGLIDRAADEHGIDVRKSIIIGDRDDIEGEMARSLGIEYRILKR